MGPWQHVVATLRSNGNPSHALILESWQRCRAGALDPDRPVELKRVDLPDLLNRQAANRGLIAAAVDLIDDFSARMGDRKHVVYITDAEGIVLYSRGTDFLMQSYGLRPGFDWSEARMGTNGAGTALAADAPVAVLGPDHWLLPFREASCLGAPIHAAGGDLIGAVDVTTSVTDCEPAQLGAVIDLARTIENRLAG